MTPLEDVDFTGVKLALEHLTSSQGLPPGQACAAIVLLVSQYVAKHEGSRVSRGMLEVAQKAVGRRDTPAILDDLEVGDWSGIEIAIDHLVSHQNMRLDLACKCVVLFALTYVVTEMGPGMGRTLVEFAQEELAKLEAQDTDP
jgi:hypothetical protein